MYKKASRLKLRFQTVTGPLSVEQLWTLSMAAIGLIVINLKKELKRNDDDDLSFLDETKTVDKTMQLRFDIAKDIYLVKKEEKEKAALKVNNDVELQKLLAIKAKRIEESKEKLSDKDLDDQIEKLSE